MTFCKLLDINPDLSVGAKETKTRHSKIIRWPEKLNF